MMMEVSASVMSLDRTAPDLSPPLRQALVRALSRRPADRFRDAAEFAEALGTRVGPAPQPQAPAPRAAPSAPAPPPRTAVPAGDETQLYSPAQTRARADATAASSGDDGGTQLFAARTGTPPVPRAAPPLAAQPQPQAQTRTGFAAPGAAVPGFGAATAAPAFAPPHAPPAPSPAQSGDALLEEARRRWRMKRLKSWVWETAVSLTVYAGFVGAWLLAVGGALEGSRDGLIVGTALTVPLTPAAIHRLTDRRGWPWLLFGASVVATGVARWSLGARTDNLYELAAIFGGQVLLCWVAARLFPRRRRRTDMEGDVA
jgi:hypothetical protein